MKRIDYILAGSLMSFVLVPGCSKQSAPPKAMSPAEVSKKITETDLISIKLTPQAEQRLGISVAEVKKEARTRF